MPGVITTEKGITAIPSIDDQHGPQDEAQADDLAYDPFDPEALKVDGLADIEVERVLTAVPVRKPNRQEFIRVHPKPEYAVDTLFLERNNGIDKQVWLVDKGIQHLVLPEMRRYRLHTAITRRGVVFLWPVMLPLEDGRDRMRRITDTALLAAEEAQKLWVRVPWNPDLGGYEIQRAKGNLDEPQWPDKTFRDLLEIAFRHNLIDAPDHPVLRELEGEL